MGSASGSAERRRGDVVVHSGDGQFGPAHLTPGQAQPVERLRRGHLVDEVEVDVEQVGLSVAGSDDVALPHLLSQRGRRAIIRLLDPVSHSEISSRYERQFTGRRFARQGQ